MISNMPCIRQSLRFGVQAAQATPTCLAHLAHLPASKGGQGQWRQASNTPKEATAALPCLGAAFPGTAPRCVHAGLPTFDAALLEPAVHKAVGDALQLGQVATDGVGGEERCQGLAHAHVGLAWQD